MLKFSIEQIAIAPRDPAAAIDLLKAIGAQDWVRDTVVAKGSVRGEPGSNTADLAFNYEMFSGKEFEVLDYKAGPNWVDNGLGRDVVCHIGMHCSEQDLLRWKDFFASRGIPVAQEVFTESHTNPFLLANGRKYNYTIFDTKSILGVDLKFIVRIEK